MMFCQMVILSDPSGGKGGDHLRKKRNNDRQYVFDVAFGADSSQAEVYEKTTRPLVRDKTLMNMSPTNILTSPSHLPVIGKPVEPFKVTMVPCL